MCWARSSDGCANSLSPCVRPRTEPDALLGLVDPVLEKTCRGDIAMLVAELVRLARRHCRPLIVVAHLRQHVLGGYELRIIVFEAGELCDVSDRAQGRAANLARAFLLQWLVT